MTTHPTYDLITVALQPQGVALIQLNRPKARNALNAPLMRELINALTLLDADDAVRCLVLTGNEQQFSAGADIKEMAGASAVEMFTRDTIGLWDYVATVKKPLIAAVAGLCLGGGLELAMACDMIFAAENAVFGQPEINLGVIPGAGGTQRLPRAIGKRLAMEVILNDRKLSAAEAAQFGLVNRVFPVETYLAETLQVAAQIAARAPLAVQLAKQAIHRVDESSLAEGLAYERRAFYFLFATADQKEGMAAFMEKRPPVWKGQ